MRKYTRGVLFRQLFYQERDTWKTKTVKNLTIYHHTTMSMMIQKSSLTKIKIAFYPWWFWPLAKSLGTHKSVALSLTQYAFDRERSVFIVKAFDRLTLRADPCCTSWYHSKCFSGYQLFCRTVKEADQSSAPQTCWWYLFFVALPPNQALHSPPESTRAYAPQVCKGKWLRIIFFPRNQLALNISLS